MPDSKSLTIPRRDWWAVGFSLVLPTAVTVVYFILLAGAPAAWQQGAYVVGKLLQFGFPLVWFWYVQRRRIAWRGPRWRELFDGGLLGAAIVVAMLLLYFGWLKDAFPPEALARIRQKTQGIGVGTGARFAALGVFYAVGHSLLEEYYWRWFVFGQLRALTAFSVAAVVSAVGFMAHHVCVLADYFGWMSPLTLFLSASVAIGGLLWAGLYQRHQSLYGVWLSHLLVDAGIFWVGYDLLMR
ncbi:MAG: CPBP family intramembrane glutamic endopeptidase [Planctomycetales bacterium]